MVQPPIFAGDNENTARDVLLAVGCRILPQITYDTNKRYLCREGRKYSRIIVSGRGKILTKPASVFKVQNGD
jgi:hypothetical protein